VPDRLADLLAVAKPIPRAAVAPLRLGVPKRAEYGPGSSRHSVLPEVVGGVLEDHVHAALAVAVLQQVGDHRVVLLGLLLVAGARLRDDARDIADGGHELLLDRF